MARLLNFKNCEIGPAEEARNLFGGDLGVNCGKLGPVCRENDAETMVKMARSGPLGA